MEKTPRPWLKALVLANFLLGTGFLVWLACAPHRAPEVETTGPGAATPAAPEAPVGPPALTTWDAIAACLDDGGGVKAGACVEDARVDGFEPGGGLNDNYFAASKAAPVVYPRSGAELVRTLRQSCERPRPQPQVQQAAAPAPPTEDEARACVLAELERRTRTR